MSEAEREARRRMLEAAVSSGRATSDEKAELEAQYQRQDRANQRGYNAATRPVQRAKGGYVSVADGCVSKGKTKGRMV